MNKEYLGYGFFRIPRIPSSRFFFGVPIPSWNNFISAFKNKNNYILSGWLFISSALFPGPGHGPGLSFLY